MHLQRAKVKKRKGDQLREQVRRIDTGEAGLIELAQHDVASRIGVNQDESREHEEEAHTDIANTREGFQPSRAGKYSHLVHVEQRYVKRREEAQRGYSRQAGTGNLEAHDTITQPAENRFL